jgi:hypothetical protein
MLWVSLYGCFHSDQTNHSDKKNLFQIGPAKRVLHRHPHYHAAIFNMYYVLQKGKVCVINPSAGSATNAIVVGRMYH